MLAVLGGQNHVPRGACKKDVAENANQQWPAIQLREELSLIGTEFCECDQCSRFKRPMALTEFAMSCNFGQSSSIPNNLISERLCYSSKVVIAVNAPPFLSCRVSDLR